MAVKGATSMLVSEGIDVLCFLKLLKVEEDRREHDDRLQRYAVDCGERNGGEDGWWRHNVVEGRGRMKVMADGETMYDGGSCPWC
ncbi:hypothetical protein L1887_31797 [Cichorium endivia]|nr:hypothetical protein L1887_31797 [Cichorium endivia]